MADKSIDQLNAAEKIYATDLFVLQQSGSAKKLTGQVLLNWLTAAADGHGGIQSIEKLSTSVLADTYRITLADTTVFDFVVNNGRGITGISKTSTSGLVDTYTISYNNGTTSTFSVKNGEKGGKGDNAYIWIKYASQKPTESSHSMGDIPDNWIGIYSGNASTAPTDWKQYKWYKFKGEKGNTGDPATLSNKSVTYQIGDSGSITPSGSWVSSVPVVPQGKYLWTKTELQFNTGDPIVSYSVARMGMDGSGTVSTVSGVSPDETGNVPLTYADVGALAVSGGDMTGEIRMNGQPISGLNAPTEGTQAANKAYVDSKLKFGGVSMANSVVMEYSLGTSFTDEQSADIRSGKFEKVHVGGYWTINGRKYWAAHADYRLHCGDTELTTHHMLVIPGKSFYNGVMNNDYYTTGSYYGSKMKTSGLADALATVKADFGTDHILTHRIILANAVSNGVSSGRAWYDSQIDLMNEKMVYGSNAWGGGAQEGSDTGIDKSQLALFQARPDLIANGDNWWLRDIQSESCFCAVNKRGNADNWGAADSIGVRPAFLIY